ncbi:hypothetical protein TUMEXPCC7403_19250 [Tumidithrix helvetica PCC 7403]|uniref:hypothetical protein n=1 Tax=Tumidithrix helvetica TaxID=3457545 RepID=UPI003CBA0659
MKAVRLNLEDRQSWQKLQHVLTSFVSDYIDLVAPEQTEFKFEQQVLSLAFTLISSRSDSDRANYFTQNLERFLSRLQLLGVRRIEFEFYSVGADSPAMTHGFDIEFVPAPTPQTTIQSVSRSAIVRSNKNQALVQTGRPGANRARGGNIVRRLQGWLTDPKLWQNLQTGSRLVVRDPKTFLEATKSAALANFNTAINWVDTFPWEEWTQSKVQWQKRRHRRNLLKALVEDFVLVGLLLVALYFATDFLSGPSVNLAALPPQHYDNSFDPTKYRCGNPGVSLKNYVCLQKDMSYPQVASILGGEGKSLGIDRKFGDRAVIISWTSGDMSMNATFVEDKLVSRAYRKLTASR